MFAEDAPLEEVPDLTPTLPTVLPEGPNLDDDSNDVESFRLGELHSPTPDLDKTFRAGENALPGSFLFDAILLLHFKSET